MALLRKLRTAWHLAASYVRGWRTGRKIVVIESDDWGSIRTSSREAYDRLVSRGWPMERSPYSLDALETEDDLDALAAVLEGVRDARGQPACMTANMIVANPDFPKIRQVEFREYHYEPVPETLRRLGRGGVMERWKQGRQRGLFLPQLHAREHIRWWDWLRALREGSPETTETFELGMCGVPLAASKERQSFYMPPYISEEDLSREGVDLEALVHQGAEMFRRQFEYDSLSVIAPNYTWTGSVEALWAREGIQYVQGGVFQFCPTARGTIRKPRFFGQRSSAGCLQLLRNCFFEPAFSGPEAVQRCLREVVRAFRFRKPAVISTHRVNYIGSIDEDNRVRSLAGLKELLTAITQRWPEVAFMSTVELGLLIERKGFSMPESRSGEG